MSTFSSPLSLEAEQSSTEELIVYEEKNITLKAPEDGKAITIKIEEVEEQVERHEQTVGIKLIVTMFGLCMSVFCVALDNTIISTAIPRITDEFHTLKDVGWYGSAYLLTTCAFQLFFGKLYFLFHIKWVFLGALLLFELGSLICGVAPNSPALIVGRAIAGVGSAGIFSGALVIVANIIPLEKRPIYQAAFGGMYGIASLLGPLIGGALVDAATWRWCFYINLPIGGATTAIVLLFLHLPSSGRFKNLGFLNSLTQMDLIGTILFILSISCLLLALQWGGTTYAWSDGRVIALFVLFGLTLIAFIGVQWWMGESATVPPRIGLQRTVGSSCFFAFCLGGAYYLLIYFLPIWFQAVLGVDALQSGIDNIAFILANTFGIFFSGGLTCATGHYMPYIYLCAIFTSVGSGLLTTLNPASSAGRWVGYQILYGFGCGCAFQQPQTAVQTVLAPQDIPIGVTITLLFTMLGGTVFVSAANNVFNNSLVQNLAALNVQNPAAIATAGATQFRSLIPGPLLPQAIDAYNSAITDTFEIALILSCVSLVGALGMEWKSVKAGRVSPKSQPEEIKESV